MSEPSENKGKHRLFPYGAQTSLCFTHLLVHLYPTANADHLVMAWKIFSLISDDLRRTRTSCWRRSIHIPAQLPAACLVSEGNKRRPTDASTRPFTECHRTGLRWWGLPTICHKCHHALTHTLQTCPLHICLGAAIDLLSVWARCFICSCPEKSEGSKRATAKPKETSPQDRDAVCNP